MRIVPLGLLLLLAVTVAALPQTGKFPPIVNTQNPKDVPPTPLESLKKITVPPGFHVTLFAGEPDVHQPIAMSLDDRGRLWVAECYTYSGQGGEKCWVTDHKDRLLILEDTDHDGKFDRRTVFGDQFQNLSGVATGFGGVWLLCAPNLLFIPVRDGKDVPAGKPEVVLDGFAVKNVGHNIVNGLTWGPDGWLYGRHGIMDTSHVGRPGSPPGQRVQLNCAIWRYHPVKKVFEVVIHGTTNPWGFDYDDHGQMFFTNNVNGHLWHVIPGAHFQRMYGEDFDPHLYELIGQHSDHLHYDATKSWTDSRDNQGKNAELGGGHSHVGAMIYLGDNWPAKYRNGIFMCNTHGHRVNNDVLARHGCGYAGRHGKDFLFANSDWFRGIDLKYGPDGGVYLSDWCDLGECHDHDGVHRTSGRIYKITYGKPAAPRIKDVSRLGNKELADLQLHANDWYVRTARRLLQERAAAGQDLQPVHQALRQVFDKNPDVTRKLRALWALYCTGGAPEAWLRQQLSHKEEHIRVWAIRLLVDEGKASAATVGQFVKLAREDDSGLVRLFLASALQRLPVPQRGLLAAALLQHEENANDHDLPLMVWYGIEPLVATDAKQALTLLQSSRFPRVRQFIARRLTEELAKKRSPVDELVRLTLDRPSTAFRLDVLRGMSDALRGWYKAAPPAGWKVLHSELAKSANKELAKLAQNLSVVFGDGRAIGELKLLALNPGADGNARRAALQVLIDSKTPDLLPLLKTLVGDRATKGTAIKGLAAYDDPKIPPLILQHYPSLSREERDSAIGALVARPSFAAELLKAVAGGRLDAADISAYHARQIASFGKDDLTRQLAKLWGNVRPTSADLKLQIEQYKKLLSPAKLKGADLSRGRLLFQQNCATCHKLFGDGAAIGPDLTGGNRDNLDYLLENIVDPSAVVAAGYRLSIVTMKDGRVFNGVVVAQTNELLTVQTQKEQLKLVRKEVDEVQPTVLSLMPDGLLSKLSHDEVVNLIGYLMSPGQVPLPAVTPKK